MGALSKFLVDEAVFSGKSLDVLCELSHLLSLELSNLRLLVECLPNADALGSQCLDLLFPLEESALVVVFLAHLN